jgi:hypothetical protein
MLDPEVNVGQFLHSAQIVRPSDEEVSGQDFHDHGAHDRERRQVGASALAFAQPPHLGCETTVAPVVGGRHACGTEPGPRAACRCATRPRAMPVRAGRRPTRAPRGPTGRAPQSAAIVGDRCPRPPTARRGRGVPMKIVSVDETPRRTATARGARPAAASRARRTPQRPGRPSR